MLPLAPRKARAQFRLCFATPDGDRLWILARLCAVTPDRAGQRFQHCVVLRPEDAESSRVFVAENLWYRAGRRELNAWMTPAQAQRWKWDLFEQSFNDNHYVRRMARFWRARELGQTILKIGADGWGAVYQAASSGQDATETERFIWRSQTRGVSHEAADMRFLRVTNRNFRRHIRARWQDGNGQIQYALRWAQLSESEKDAVSFGCDNGTWAQLRAVAAWVLTIRVAQQKRRPESCAWKISDYGWITVQDNAELTGDEALLTWRGALTQAFGAHGVDIAGVKIDSLPLCLWSYIDDHEQCLIEILAPTMHETMEAQLQLCDWTNRHFAPDEAARLLALLGLTR